MREKYWAHYSEKKYESFYYKYYAIRAQRFDYIVTGAALLASIGSIATWGIWQQLPLLWGILIAAAQVSQALRPIYPFSKQLIALKYVRPRFDKLLIEMEYEWDMLLIRNTTDEKIAELLAGFEQNFAEVESSFIGDIYFADSKQCINRAKDQQQKFFYTRFGIKEELQNV
jgi:hypothetical protein